MDIDIPGAAAAQQRATLEEELATVFEALLEDASTSQNVVGETYNVCLGRVEALRAEAAEQLHRPARHMTLKALAEEMEAQAATWQLLFCLYCDQAPPAGNGGARVMDAGGTPLYRQRLADRVGNDVELARCARVVSWLESLADDAVKRQGGVAFAPGEGLWHETKTEMHSRADALVSELDPDAPGRSGRPLHPSNARSQERILARVWQYIRAGNLAEAQDLCRQVGQSWRAAALGGGGPVGALPVGLAAAEYDEKAMVDLQVEELADEVANGSGSLLALWRWAAQQAAAAPPGDKFERAVFGALGGSTAAAAPACTTWEDFAWVYCRSWLEAQAMRCVTPEPQAVGDLVAGDAVMAALVRCGVAPAVAQRSVEGALSVAMGGGSVAAAAAAAVVYDSDAITAAAAAAAVTTSHGFGQLFAQHVMSPAALVNSGPAAVQALRLVQGLLVQGDMHALTQHLFVTLAERRGGGGADADGEEGTAAAAPSVAAAVAAFSATSPERRRRMCALAAHMLLALEGLGVLMGHLGPVTLAPESVEAHSILDTAQRLIGFYAGTLLEQEQLRLVPPYLCVLPPPLRSSLCGELLALHTRRLTGVDAMCRDGAVDDAEALRCALAEAEAGCQEAVVALDYWFRRCAERQVKPPSERTSLLETSIRKDELRIQLATFTLACRHNREYGPHQRARVARWLALPHIIAIQAVQAAVTDADTAAEGAEDDIDVAAADAAAADALYVAAGRLDPWSYYDVLDFANCLCCEFALGDDVTGAAGHRLFEEVLPADIEVAAYTAADLLESAAATAVAALPGPSVAAFNEGALDSQQLDAGKQLQLQVLVPRGDRPQRPVGEAALRLAAQLRERATELAAWRLYFELDARLAAWTARHEAHEQQRASSGAAAAAQGLGLAMEGEEQQAAEGEVEALRAEGGELLRAFLEGLLQTGWQHGLATAERALGAADAEGQLRLALTVTCPPGPGSGSGSGSAPLGHPAGCASWGQPTAPYPELQGAALLEFQEALEGGLRRAAAERGVAVEVPVESGPSDPPGRGHVTLIMAVGADAKLWRGLVDLVCGVVRGEVEGVPPLLLVGLEADRATSLAVCRRCCIGQAVMRCAALRLSLVGLGADAESDTTGLQLVELLAAPAEAFGGYGAAAAAAGDGTNGLLELLGPAQLASVLMLEADTYEQHLRNRQGCREQQQLLMQQ